MHMSELGLTPLQISELEQLEPAYVEAWLVAAGEATGLKSRTGWFLAGIRSGRLPGEQSEGRRTVALRKAERWMRTAGMFEPNETSALEALFGHHGREKGGADGILEPFDSPELRERLGALYREQRPLGMQTEADAKARAAAWRRTREALRQKAATPETFTGDRDLAEP